MPNAGLALTMYLLWFCRGNQEDGSGRCWCRPTTQSVADQISNPPWIGLTLADSPLIWMVWSVCLPFRLAFTPSASVVVMMGFSSRGESRLPNSGVLQTEEVDLFARIH